MPTATPVVPCSADLDAALRRAIIRVIPAYYARSPEEQERYRLNLDRNQDFRIRQSLLKTLFGFDAADEEAMDEILREFDDSQYLLLNSALLPLYGIGEDHFFLNESMAEGVTLLDFETVGDYARDDHEFQEKARKEDSPDYQAKPYRGNLSPCWARLNLDGTFHYATLYSLAGFLSDAIEETGMERIETLIPHRFVEGKRHGQREEGGYRYDMRVDAGGQEAPLEELQRRFHEYQNARYECLLDRLDTEGARKVFLRRDPASSDPQLRVIFSDKTALDAVRFKHFVRDCRAIEGQIADLDILADQERSQATDFLEGEFRDIQANFDPTVVQLRKKRKIILAEGVAGELL